MKTILTIPASSSRGVSRTRIPLHPVGVALGFAAILASLTATLPAAESDFDRQAKAHHRLPHPVRSEERSLDAHRQRAFPLEVVPPGARLRALEQIEQAKAQAAAQAQFSPAGGFLPMAWYHIGPAPIMLGNVANSGRVSAIAVDPADANHWLIGAAQGGIWESRNAGSSWTARTDDKASLAMGAITFAPSDPNVIYAGTGEANFTIESYGGAGLLKSINGGATWFLLASAQFAQSAFSDIRVHPTDPTRLVAATTRAVQGRVAAGTNIPPLSPPRGIFRSVDGGVTWTQTLAGEATDLEMDPGSFNRQYAALGEIYGHPTNGVYRSSNSGQNWTRINGPWASMIEATNTGRIELAIAPSDPNTLYVSVARKRFASGPLLGIWRTQNAWAPTPTWTQISSPGNPSTGEHLWYYHELSVHPADPTTLFFGERDLWKYFGITWTEMLPANVHQDLHAFAWHRTVGNDRLVIGNDGGVWSVKHDNSVWLNHNNGLEITQFYDGSVHPGDGDLALGGSQDNGTEVWTGDLAWHHIYTGDGADNAISAGNPENHWALSYQEAKVLRTKDGGVNISSAKSGLSTGGAPFITRFEKHPGIDDLFILGTTRLWRCTNFFSATTPTWKTNGPILTLPDGSPTTITALAFAPSGTGGLTYAFGTRDGQLWRTTTGGSSWTDIDPTGAVPNRYVTDMAFDPGNSSVLYVTLSGFDEGTPGAPGHVFKRTVFFGGATWTNVSPPVNLPHNTIVVSPVNPNLIYVGTDIGVWRSTTAGATWVHLGPETGLPNVAVFDLQSSAAGALTAFTHGRGAFTYRMAGPKVQIPKPNCVFPCDLNWVHPGDLVTLDIPLQSIITEDAVNLTARVLNTDDVTSRSGPQTYGRLTVNGPPVTRSFQMQIGAAGAACGSIATVTLALEDEGGSLGNVTMSVRLGRPDQPFSENFEHTTPPALPTGWQVAHTGADAPWIITTNRPPDEIPRRSPPDAVGLDPDPSLLPPDVAAFAPAPAGVSDNSLTSPRFRVQGASARLAFRHAFDFEEGLDGGVLDISIGGQPFVDITRASATFADNGYSQRLTGSTSPLAGRDAWSGNSGGWLMTLVDLPTAAVGQDVQLRWRAATDAAVGGQGWFIGSVTITDYTCLPPVESPVILRPRRISGSFAFDFATVAGRTYFVEYKNSLNDVSWRPLETVVGNSVEHTILDGTGLGAQRFYRFRVE